MKKAKRLLSVLLAFVMIFSMMSTMASAYQKYKDDGLTQYDGADLPVLTTEQYASMILDAVDKLLAQENITVGAPLNIDLTSINSALSSIYNLRKGALFFFAQILLGDLKNIEIGRAHV